ncbi:RNA polymerase sigma factor [Alteromonas flava]|uniref:RNA polymerase sigma factor n=1 Tax=Alteromonas flava TaxID=2048003 RepID=UPI001F0BD83B|nr:sigma-70 family RNA polymerase sigma factor [Alteromonas flava]
MSLSIAIRGWFSKSVSNEQLMQQYARDRQRQLLAQLYENCGDDLYHFLLTLSDPAKAEDIAQQVWLKVIEKSHLYQPNGQFKSWLFTIGRRLLLDELRRDAKLTSQSFSDAESADINIDRTDELVLFNQLLNSLPFAQKEAFCLQQEGFSLEEIAAITHCSRETVKSRLRYAKQKLCQHMTDTTDFGDSDG